ncbi:3-isopropylmalate dehydratase [Ureibacillus chungkukjangi]|uniref:3-isopropylmalate dehydratase n=1 Tax=Ureibacillus chungkukjangi TaxID=1202712 RepID=UPI002041A0BF|nr:3-isopropylmalate dehydratase [Ureibacillus chungkukjangi]MCM3387294.1 3-isopropylmalate dehydratase [Ureibacillus chungkukjangi]
MKIVKLKNAKFGNELVYTLVNGYALYEDGKGYVAYTSNVNEYGFLTPYIPCGGKKALASILETGGFVNFDGMEFVNTLN